jgi:hypothetical protein
VSDLEYSAELPGFQVAIIQSVSGETFCRLSENSNFIRNRPIEQVHHWTPRMSRAAICLRRLGS